MKKKHARKLNKLAEKLGDIQTHIMTDEPIMGWELLLSGFGKGPRAKNIIPDREYILSVPCIIHHSAKKELKRNWKKGGAENVIKTVQSQLSKRKRSINHDISNEKE